MTACAHTGVARIEPWRSQVAAGPWVPRGQRHSGAPYPSCRAHASRRKLRAALIIAGATAMGARPLDAPRKSRLSPPDGPGPMLRSLSKRQSRTRGLSAARGLWRPAGGGGAGRRRTMPLFDFDLDELRWEWISLCVYPPIFRGLCNCIPV